MRDEKFNSHMKKFLRGAIIIFALFVLLSVPVHARPWDNLIPASSTGTFHFPPFNFSTIPIAQPTPRGWQSSMLSDIELTRRQEGLDIRGRVPVIANSFESSALLNSHINDEIVTPLIAEARRLRARTISFRYEYHPADNIVSIVIYANVATSLPHTLVRSVNFCMTSGKILSVNEAADMEIAPLAERILAEKIRSNPERYYAALSAPLAGQAFFITPDKLVVLFDGFRLSTRVGDVDTIELHLENITTVILTPDDYRADGPYGLKMIPLREMVVRRLSYSLRSNADRSVTISRNDVDLIELRNGDNDYIVLGTQRRSLEAAPQIFETTVDGIAIPRTYVPITFFDQILPLTTYTIDTDGNITFLAYFSNRERSDD
jgi:hypothetical protein